MAKNLYSAGYVVNYPEGDISLERVKIIHIEDIDDKAYTIREGDTLSYISFKFYGNPLYWYLIADVNEIDNPFDLEIGLNLIIPNINRYDV